MIRQSKPEPLPDIIEAKEVNEYQTKQSKEYICLKIPTEHPLSFYLKDAYDRQPNNDLIRKGYTPPNPPLLDNINYIHTKENIISKTTPRTPQNDSSEGEHITSDNPSTKRPQNDPKTTPLWDDVRAFIQDNAGKPITYEQIDREFGIRTPSDRKMRRKVVFRLVESGKAEKLGLGKFRLYDEAFQEFSPNREEDLEPLDIVLPLGLSEHTQFYKGNAISYEGNSDAGKTLLAIETVKLNLDKFNWHYWWAETGAEEFYARASDYLGLPNPHFHLYERDENFVDCIRRYPNDCHICDYVGRLEGEWNLLGSDISKMISALKDGFLVINLQSNPLTGYAFGGAETRHRCRLCLKLTLDKQTGITTVKVERVKTPKRGGQSIRGQECAFQPNSSGVGVEMTRDWEQGH